MLGNGGYEACYQESLLRTICLGDVIWDVGANIGFYSKRFADLAGAAGKVIAFEPNPSAVEQLRLALTQFANVQICPIGLSNVPENAVFSLGAEPASTTGHIALEQSNESNTIRVTLNAGDTLVAEGLVPQPTVIKIDVEGYELEVLQGLQRCLRNEALKVVGIEVHFGHLAARGLERAPAQIEALLGAAGFGLQWPDPSHVLAVRVMRSGKHLS